MATTASVVHRLLVMCVVIAAAVVTLATVVPAGHAADRPTVPNLRKCGTLKAKVTLHVFARHITCHTARRIQNEFWNGPWSGKHTSRKTGLTTLDRFPGWRCESAAGGGACTKGAKVS